MSKLLLPLNCYDEAGRVRPPIELWICALYLAKTYLIFIASLSFRQDSEGLLALFYPVKQDLYLGLLIGMSGILVFGFCGFREKIWKTGKTVIFTSIRPLILIGLFVDALFHLYLANQQYWQFSWNVGASLLLDFFWFYWALSSRHLAFMLLDWKFELNSQVH